METASARVVLALSAVLIAVGGPLGVYNLARDGGASDLTNLLMLVPAVAFGAVGYLISRRLPGNAVGSICLTIGLLWGVVMAGGVIALWAIESRRMSLGAAGWVNWTGALWVPAVGLMGTHLPPSGSRTGVCAHDGGGSTPTCAPQFSSSPPCWS